ncbi:cytochrome P450 [Pholiota molesta]|nr:cytochrome P450 [Pholiota molesta]
MGLWKLFRQFFVKTALDNIAGPTPTHSGKVEGFLLFSGAFLQVFNINAWDFHKEMAEKYGSVIKIKALFGAMHHIIVKDQYIYEETSAFIEGNKLIFGPGLLGTLNEQHRKQRKMLNPVFSVAHMREMIPTFYNITHKLEDAFAKRIDVMSWMTRTALELIAQSGLGYSFDPLTEDAVPHPYSTRISHSGNPSSLKVLFPRTYLLAPIVKLASPRVRRFFMDLLPWKTLHNIRDLSDLLHKTSLEIFEGKRKALAEGDEAVERQIGQGKDIMSILMRANMEASKEDSLTEGSSWTSLVSLLVSPSLTFAAMDTTSSALSRILFLLAHHQDVQDKLRQEIREARKEHGENLMYDQLVALPYLDAICRETLRLYAPVSTVQRTTRQDVVLPLSTPIRGLDGEEMREIPIPRNTNVIVGIMAANRNPEIWGPTLMNGSPKETVGSAHLPGIYSHL